MTARRIALIAVVALLAAVLGVYIGRAVLPQPKHTGAELHTLLHEDLGLDATQRAKLGAIEKDFANARRTLDAQLRADNARMAEAIAAEHVYGPRVAGRACLCRQFPVVDRRCQRGLRRRDARE